MHLLGIDVQTKTTVEKIEKTATGYQVFSTRDGKQVMCEADVVVHAAGRKPAFEALDLAAADIVIVKGRLKLNEYLKLN